MSDTISQEYLDLNRDLHERDSSYGTSGRHYAPIILSTARNYGAVDVLDWACGKGTLAPILRANGLETFEYDPAIPGKDAAPKPADLVYAGDVMEHIEREYIGAVLDNLRDLTKKAILLTVATRPALKTLADGRNAHLIVEPLEWWLPLLRERFDMAELKAVPENFVFVGVPK